jgi:AraC family transcriptional regulator, regulatory protein of adaptative response / DNA-3-methyladenine glycosylase II
VARSELDGWLTQGVVTTKIYCRPGCGGRPKPENVRVLESPAAARALGMRACKRCKPDEAYGEDWIVRHLPYTAPLDADALLAFFGRRAVPGVEQFEDGVFRRSLRLAHGNGVVELRPLDGVIAARFLLDDARDEDDLVTRVRAMLDLDADPARVADALSADPVMRPLVDAAPGRRVPGAADGDEIAIRAVLGQQVSLAGAATLAGRLVAAYGEPLANPVGGVTHAWPAAGVLADAARGPDARRGAADRRVTARRGTEAADGSPWAMPASRIRAIGALAEALASGEVVLDADADRSATEDRLLALPGIGPWTASYIRMRALHDYDAFLASDLGVKHALDRLGLDSRPAAAELISLAWRPYRAYALQHLWAVTA